jgi:23S rRNA (guanosine2251-2'-O)-methyltransferase
MQMRREERRLVQIEGRNAVLESLRSERQIARVILDTAAGERDQRISEILALCRSRDIRLARAPRSEMDRMARGRSHQGVIALAEPRPSVSLDQVLDACEQGGNDPCLLLLRQVVHEQNLGAILRTAEAAGVDAVVVPTFRGAEIGPEASRVSQGASEYVPLVRQSLTQAAAILKKRGVRLIGSDPAGKKTYWECDLTGPLCIALGGEHAGLEGPLAKRCDELVRIPMLGRVSSLNVSVACAILLYERMRQSNSPARPY